MNLPTIGKSTLFGFKYRLIGFGYIPHPSGNGKIQITFFHQLSESGMFLICFSDVSNNQSKEFSKTLRKELGKVVDANEVIPYVQRSINNTNFEEFQNIMRIGFKDQAAELHWKK